ncbi:MAG TPA: DUF1003 domain-containing protein [Bacteroidia bacterium]|nr:DUF1003 domain-containing protein [Bacteroidia bacterium]
MISYISKTKIRNGEAVKVEEIREGIFNLIQGEHPQITKDDYISIDELNHYRRLYITTLTKVEIGTLADLDDEVMNAINNNAILSEKLEGELSIGDKLADRIALFGGSWTFIIVFFVLILLWICTNIWLLQAHPFDPFPFILLNLILSCLAAIQAPIIMMSQNRQEQKDRQRAEQDYKINLKAELEIKLLNEKIDHLIVYQNNKLLEIQQIQTDYLEDLINELKKK